MDRKVRLSRARPDLRRDHILQIARRAFAEEGYGATSMSALAARLGGSKGTLYRYFSSKEQLFAAVMEQTCIEAMGPIRESKLPYTDLYSALIAYGGMLLKALLLPPVVDIYRLVHAEGIRFPEISTIFFFSGPDPYYDTLEEVLIDLAARGQIRCSDPKLTAMQFAGMVRGDIHMRVSIGGAPAPSDAEIDRQVVHAARIFVDGLSVQPRQKND